MDDGALLGGEPHGSRTVGCYLDTPTRDSAVRRAETLALSAGALALVLSAFVYALRGRVSELELPGASMIDLGQCVVALAVVGFALLAAAVAFRLMARFNGMASHDYRDLVRKAVLALMVKIPRFGITRNTKVADVGVRCEFLGKGAGTGAVKCWNASGAPFVKDDFKGCAPSYFGGVDYYLDGSMLLVFFTIEAKRGYFERLGKSGCAR